jgi:hypothetical protein
MMNDDTYESVFCIKIMLVWQQVNELFTSHVIYVHLLSLTGFEEEPEQVGVGVGLEPIHYIRFCYGDYSCDSLSSEDVMYKEKIKDLTKGGSDNLSEKQVYNIDLTNKYIMVAVNSEKQMRFSVYNSGCKFRVSNTVLQFR